MNLFLHIQITDKPEEIIFYNPIIAFLKEQKSEFILYDFDNHSDSLIIGYAKKLIADSEKTVIFIETMPESNFKNLMPLFTSFLDNPEQLQFVLKGDNPRLEKILSILTYIKVPENTLTKEPIESIIKQFF